MPRLNRCVTAILLLLAPALASAEGYAPQPIGDDAYTILSAVYDYDPEIPLDGRVVELKEEDDTILRKIVFRGARGFMVPARMEVAKSATAPYPCVVLTHGWSGSKEDWWEDGNYISGGDVRKALLAKGYAVFAIDAQAHGERTGENGYAEVNIYDGPESPKRLNYFTLREIITQTTIDIRRGLDYLATRGDIDMNRIGVQGYSMGGFHAVALTAVEPRIKVAVGCVIPVTWRDDPILDPANYVRAIGARPFYMVFGKIDGLCDEADGRTLYGLLQGQDNALAVIDAGHRLPVDYVPEAVAFMTDRL